MIDAYVLLDVMPPNSPTVAETIWGKYRDIIQYSVVVWGPWDVVLRVRVQSENELFSFLNYLHKEETAIKRTQTLRIRTDQYEEAKSQPIGKRWAFVLLNVSPTWIESTIQNIARLGLVKEIGGVLGSADMVLTVRYEADNELRNLVMYEIQGLGRVTSSQTVMGVEGMTWVSSAADRGAGG